MSYYRSKDLIVDGLKADSFKFSCQSIDQIIVSAEQPTIKVELILKDFKVVGYLKDQSHLNFSFTAPLDLEQFGEEALVQVTNQTLGKQIITISILGS